MIRARLRLGWTRHHPVLEVGRGYDVVGEEPLCLWLVDDGGDPLVAGGRRFVASHHLDLVGEGN